MSGMQNDQLKLLQDTVFEIQEAVESDEEQILRQHVQLRATFLRNFAQLASYLADGGVPPEARAKKAEQTALGALRALTDFVSDDINPVLSKLVRLRALGSKFQAQNKSEKYTLPQGTRAFIGAPQNPMPATRFEALATLIKSFNDIAFAYVPLVYIKGQIDPPQQILYIVFRNGDDDRVSRTMGQLTPAVHKLLPVGDSIDIYPALYGHPWFNDVIGTRCLLAVNDSLEYQAILQG